MPIRSLPSYKSRNYDSYGKSSPIRSRLEQLRREDAFLSADWAVNLLIFMLILGLVAYIVAAIIGAGSATVSDAAETPVEPAETASAATSEPFVFPWELLGGIVVSVLAVVAILGIIGGIVMYAVKKHKKQAKVALQQQKANVTKREVLTILQDKHSGIISKWADYELSPEKLIRYPVFSDHTNSITATFIQSLHNAELSKPRVSKDEDMANTDLKEYRVAVGELESSFKSLETAAIRTGQMNFSAEERKKLKRATDLLAIAQNAAASPHERQGAYKQVLKLVENLVVIPEKPRMTIETSIRKQLEGPTAQEQSAPEIPEVVTDVAHKGNFLGKRMAPRKKKSSRIAG